MSLYDDAIEAGFTEEQADFIAERLAVVGHKHEIEDIDGLEEELEGEEEE
jgi:hypothetical protein